MVEQPALPLSPPPSISHHHHHHSDHHLASSTRDIVDPNETNPLRMLRSGFGVRPRVRGNKHHSVHSLHDRTKVAPRQQQRHASVGERNGRALLPRPPSDVAGVTSILPSQVASTTPDEESGEEDEDEGNPIPLPPRDRSRSMPEQPRHHRKHPLVFPGVGTSHTLGHVSSGGGSQSSLDGSASHNNIRTDVADAQFNEVSADDKRPRSPSKSPGILCNMDDSFENQIASELDALDNIPEEETAVVPPVLPIHPQRHSVHVVHQSFPHPSQPPPPPPTSVPPSTPSPTPPSIPRHSEEEEDSSCKEEEDVDANDNGDSQMLRNGDHVSCEDLLEFACDGPNVRRTRGRARGVDSDEVRIMGKVLGKEVSKEACVSALNSTDWDVHRAIKVVHLQTLLLSSSSSSAIHSTNSSSYGLSSPLLPGTVDPMSAFEALSVCGWDVARAAGWYLAGKEEGDTTEV
ncbi:hypothetical protein J437_LFUL007590 [Ladona fulva]|uniref:Uncharacterized protein n=1 Tax=Ladona fulva TaxID=123851 RepID=A0A8K0K886_LADFU|nr:hypothetical protein J437_LFUL007590 [Ladona fulva]